MVIGGCANRDDNQTRAYRDYKSGYNGKTTLLDHCSPDATWHPFADGTLAASRHDRQVIAAVSSPVASSRVPDVLGSRPLPGFPLMFLGPRGGVSMVRWRGLVTGARPGRA